jgi:hypothetical protein
MRIAILEFSADQKSATGVRGRAMKRYLEGCGHVVDVLAPEASEIRDFESSRFGISARLKRRLTGGKTLPHLWDFVADLLEPRIRKGAYDAVIGRGQDVGYVLTRPLDCLKILDMANILFLEGYYAWGTNLNEVEETFDKEMRVFKSVDYILSPHELLTEYFIDQFDSDHSLKQKVVTVRLGCDAPKVCASFSSEPRIAYAGSYYYIQDPYLLAQLTKISPFPIDCYGAKDPNRRFLPARLNYRGYVESMDFLADYQFGLITVSRDDLRQNSPATKFPYYFSYGLPVLFPEWMKEGYEYPDFAIAFNEDNFVDRVRGAAQKERWERMSQQSREAARALTWENVLRPLANLLSSPESAQSQSSHDSSRPIFAR